MDEQDQKALDDIEKYGCHILNIIEGEGQPCFSYSIGIYKKQKKPDLIIYGLKRELAQAMINDYCERLYSGEIFEPGRYYSDSIEGFAVCFTRVSKKYYKEHFGWGLWLHDGENFEVLQLVWPTTDGVWPWDEGTSEYYKWAQPILNEDGVIEKINH